VHGRRLQVKFSKVAKVFECELELDKPSLIGEYEFEFLPRAGDWIQIAKAGALQRYHVDNVIHKAKLSVTRPSIDILVTWMGELD